MDDKVLKRGIIVTVIISAALALACWIWYTPQEQEQSASAEEAPAVNHDDAASRAEIVISHLTPKKQQEMQAVGRYVEKEFIYYTGDIQLLLDDAEAGTEQDVYWVLKDTETPPDHQVADFLTEQFEIEKYISDIQDADPEVFQALLQNMRVFNGVLRNLRGITAKDVSSVKEISDSYAESVKNATPYFNLLDEQN